MRLTITPSRFYRLALGIAALVLLASPVLAEIKPGTLGSFIVDLETVVPATAEQAFDAFSGDVSPWWDQRYSEAPVRLYIEPRPGGSFVEIFDEAGNGALHATVIFALRGRRLRFTGPMGFSGFPLEMVHTVDFDTGDAPGTTRVHLYVRAAGQVEPQWAEGIERIWKHLLLERYKPYVESMKPEAPAP